MNFQRRHSCSSLYSISDLVDLDVDDDASTTTTIEINRAPVSSSRPSLPRANSMSSLGGRSVQRRNSLSSISSVSGKVGAVVSLGLIAGSSAFGTSAPQTAFRTSSKPNISRRGSLESASSERSLTSMHNSQQSLSTMHDSQRSLVSTNMLPMDSVIDVATSAATTASQVSSMLGGSPLADMSSSILGLSKISTTEMIGSAVLSAARSFYGNDKDMEASLCGDLSLATALFQFIPCNKNVVHVTGILGRIFSLMADYIPDQMVSPEEAVFQACMLGVSATGIAKAVKPIIHAQTQEATFSEKKVYAQLFRKFDMPWAQAKSIMTEAADWVELDAYQSVDDNTDSNNEEGEYLYWTARGEAFDLDVDSSSLGLLGTLNLAEKLKQIKNKTDQNDENSPLRSNIRACTPRAGASGAKLLRIDTSKLLEMIKDDEQMTESVTSMVFADMQEKLLSFVGSKDAPVAPSKVPGEVEFAQ